VIKTTNIAAVIVTATNGAGYNGPAIGESWTNTSYADGNYTFTGTGVSYAVGYVLFGPLSNVAEWTVWPDETPQNYYLNSGTPTVFPATLTGREGATGALTLDWLTHTTTNTYDLASFLRYTNGTTHADGVLNGTNGVYWTKLGTNFWILLP
jgi:hypothetical protein